MEHAIVAALAEEGVQARARVEDGLDYTGVWVGERKIASIGVHVSRGVTTHGFAVNVDNDLEPFSWVVACGLPDVHDDLARRASRGAAAEGIACFRRRMALRFCERARPPPAPGLATAPRASRTPPAAQARRGGAPHHRAAGRRCPRERDALARQPRRDGRAAACSAPTCGRCASASRRGSRCRRPAASATAS